LPDKAIDVIDEAGAAQRILPKSKQKKVIKRPISRRLLPRLPAFLRSTSRWMTAVR
jgi:ATP-dependent Clp protease ATP-binding subunit ClpA